VSLRLWPYPLLLVIAGCGLPQSPPLWALGWTVTTLVGVAVDEQFSVFGAAGAVTFSALSGVLLNVLLPVRASNATVDANPAGATVKGNA
jgi:hypothetical protein